MKKATLCFLISGDKILMINRNKPPFMGMWNAVGGKLIDGETEEACAIREIKEETGISVTDPELFSVFTWNYDDEVGYAFKVDLGEIDFSAYPMATEEGILDFKPISWIINPKNYGVIDDLRLFVADIENGVKQDYHLIYEDKKLIKFIKK